MSRAMCLLALGGLLGFAVATAAAPALKSRPAPDPHLGRWAATGIHVNGQPSQQWQGLEYEFAPAGRWVIYRDGQELGGGPRSFAADPKAKVPTIDLTENQQTHLGVYQVGPGGDTLTVSFNIVNGGGRPAGIEPGAETITITFRRAKAN
jgi:uncharacterized protein (TIGR03067 family)